MATMILPRQALLINPSVGAEFIGNQVHIAPTNLYDSDPVCTIRGFTECLWQI